MKPTRSLTIITLLATTLISSGCGGDIDCDQLRTLPKGALSSGSFGHTEVNKQPTWHPWGQHDAQRAVIANDTITIRFTDEQGRERVETWRLTTPRYHSDELCAQ
jgi:hypothetical protein